MLEILFVKGRKTTKSVDLKRRRPSDAELDDYFKLASRYFTLLEEISPELKQCLTSDGPKDEIEKHRHNKGGHILFRPVGLLLYTEIAATLMRTDSLSLEESVAELSVLPTELSAPPYVGILWDSATATMNIKNRALTRELLLYFLGRVQEPTRVKKLTARYALLLNDDTETPPTRTPAKTKRIVRRPPGNRSDTK